MSLDPVSVKPNRDPEPALPSAETQAQQLLHQGKRRLRLLVVVTFACAASVLLLKYVTGWLRSAEARGVAMKRFPAELATIGNALWPEERPEHEVLLAAYELDLTEVTVGAYDACRLDGACSVPAKGAFCNSAARAKDHPINCVTNAQAAMFCKWASKRLPTEREWEHAARAAHDDPMAREKGLFPWGVGAPNAVRLNACGKECTEHFAALGRNAPGLHAYDDGFSLTAPVGHFKEGDTKDGISDMAGNVWEWTSSPFCPYLDESCSNDHVFVIRGGGFQSYQPHTFEATSRESLSGDEATETVGFRCAR